MPEKTWVKPHDIMKKRSYTLRKATGPLKHQDAIGPRNSDLLYVRNNDGDENHLESKAMATAIHAVFEHGVFRPMQPVDLPDRCEVEVEIRAITSVDGAEEQFPEESATMLSDRDRDRFLELLENPPPPNAALRKAIALHR